MDCDGRDQGRAGSWSGAPCDHQGRDRVQYAAIVESDFKRLSITLGHRGTIVGACRLTPLLPECSSRCSGSTKTSGARRSGRRCIGPPKWRPATGVKHVYVDSFSFQAPGFYKKLGYREYGRLKGFPTGQYASG